MEPSLRASAARGGSPRCVFVSSGGMYTTKWPKWEVRHALLGALQTVRVEAFRSKVDEFVPESQHVNLRIVSW